MTLRRTKPGQRPRKSPATTPALYSHARSEAAMDAVAGRFGPRAIVYGRELEGGERPQSLPHRSMIRGFWPMVH